MAKGRCPLFCPQMALARAPRVPCGRMIDAWPLPCRIPPPPRKLYRETGDTYSTFPVSLMGPLAAFSMPRRLP